jgi:putative transposase
MEVVLATAVDTGVAPACDALGLSRATLYRYQGFLGQPSTLKPRGTSFRALSELERDTILGILSSDRFCDMAPSEIYATLLDEGEHYCSIRTMYRIIAMHSEVRERRDQLRHPAYKKPELLATKPNQVWSWDITKLMGPVKWSYFYLYVILDIFSRYVVGWMVAPRESATLAEQLIGETYTKEGVQPGELTLHADRGSSMKSKAVALLLCDLNVLKTHSRPYVSDDNPYSEAQFKTLKYRPDFPKNFGCIEDSRAFCRAFMTWYNTEHHHSGIKLLTPSVVHHGMAKQILDARQAVLDEAFARHAERYGSSPPRSGTPPAAVWINKPKESEVATQQDGH